MSAELGLSIAGISIELIVAITAVLGLCLGATNTLILVLQSWLDRHKVHRLVITKEHERKKRDDDLINSLTTLISESPLASNERNSTPERHDV
jgi:hypothetical protein